MASVKVRDGLVLGTDSMTQLVATNEDGQPLFVKAYANARKLFELNPARRAGVMTFGLGNIGDHSIEGLVREFRGTLNEDVTIMEIAARLFDFMQPRWRHAVGDSPDPVQHQLGFCVAGYSPQAHFAEVYEFILPRDSAPVIASGEDAFGLLWRGIDSPLIRLVKGWDPRIFPALAAVGLTPEQAVQLLQPLEWFFSQPGMPLQDAINLLEFLLATTVGTARFVDANPTCGGPLQIATILPDRGFTWIKRQELS